MKVSFCICRAAPLDCPIHQKKRNKYGAQRTEVAGISFQSKKEAKRFMELEQAKEAGALIYFHRQVPFRLPGKITYWLDFLEFWADGTVGFVDTKGFRTRVYINKKKQVEELYEIQITEI